MARPSMRFAARLCAVAMLSPAFAASAADCNVSQATIQQESLVILRTDYPDRTFSAGEDPDLILMGDVQFGLDNLYARICLEPLSATDRADHIRTHFSRMIEMVDEQADLELPPWEEARKVLSAQFASEDYVSLMKADRLVTRPFIPGVVMTVVLDRPDSYKYVMGDNLEEWGVSREALYEEALRGLERMSEGVKLEGSEGAEKYLALETTDGFAAARIMVQDVRTAAAKLLGDPFLAGIPNRDFLVMWSTANSKGFQDGVRIQVRTDFESQPYALSPTILRVWADGRIEVDGR